MKFIFKNYPAAVGTAIVNANNVDWQGHNFVRFSSYENNKILVHYYKYEMQQGEKPTSANFGHKYIKASGFIDAGYKHWNEFERYAKSIVYSYKLISNDIIEIFPLSYTEYKDLEKSEIIEI